MRQRKSGPSSSRQPPLVGGTPPLPRSFTNPPTRTAITATIRPRRSAFMVGSVGLVARRASGQVGLEHPRTGPSWSAGEDACVGLGGIEPPTSSLSGMRSNRLSYSPEESRRVPAAAAAGRRLARSTLAGGRVLLDDRDLDATEELGEQVVERARQDSRDDLDGDQ